MKMKYIKRYNEDIDWEFDYEERDEEEIPYEKNGILYGLNLSKGSNELKGKIKYDLEDRVVCTNNFFNNVLFYKEGEIVDYNVYNKHYLIYFYDYIRGHSDNNIPHGHGWWLLERDIKKI